MKQLIESGAARICAVTHDICAHIDFDVVSLPGGSLIALLLSLYAIATASIRRAAVQNGVFGAAPMVCSGTYVRLAANGPCVGSA